VSDYIDFSAVGQVLLYSLLAVLVVVGAFSVGALRLARAEGARESGRPATAQLAFAWLCFAVAGSGVIVGVWFILDK
jgi:hypothetical protein